MLSHKLVSRLLLCTRILGYIGGTPYKWKTFKRFHRKRLLFLSTSKTSKAFFIFLTLFCVLYEILLIYRLITKLLPSENSAIDLDSKFLDIHQLAWTIVCYMLLVLAQVHTIAHYKSIPLFLNAFLCFHERFGSTSIFNGIRDDNKTSFRMVFRLMTLAGLIVTSVNIVTILKYPERTYFLCSFFSNYSIWPIYWKLCLILLHVWKWIALWVYVYFYAYQMIFYSTATFQVFKDLKCVILYLHFYNRNLKH